MTVLSEANIGYIKETLERLEKSFNAMGYPHANEGGKTGVAALAIVSMDPVMHSIAASEKVFNLIKDIKREKAISSVHKYVVETAVSTAGIDLAGTENFLPSEDISQFETVIEVLKVYGIRKTLGQMAQLSNEAGGFSIDIEKQNEVSAIKALNLQFERDLYSGGDYWLNPTTSLIDPMVANMYFGRNAPCAIRQLRGIQANVREGNMATRGISGDYAAYGNSFITMIDLAGAAIDQDAIDDLACAISSNGQSVVAEAHCTAAQAVEFRKTLFPIQRGDISSKFAVQGPDVSGYEGGGFDVLSVEGPIRFKSCVLKNAVRQKAIPVNGSAGVAPSAPTLAAQASTAITGVTSPFTAAQSIRVVVQAGSINGLSSPTAATLTVTNAGEAAKVRITHVAGADHYVLFANPAGNTTVGLEGFVGRVLVPAGTAVGGVFDISLSGAILPSFEDVVFMPADDGNRCKLATLGNLINKVPLGVQGLAFETAFASYLCLVLPKPRSFGLLTNPKSRVRPLR